MTRPRILGLCEGYGGLTMGVQAVLGGELVAYAEIKPAACALLAARHPGLPNYGDLTAADFSGVTADIVTAGWPCQPHSSAGKRLGEEDPRAIWPEVLGVIDTVRPLLFVGENVARVATNGELRRVVASLAAIGYVGAWRCLPAAEFGAPHKRDRLCLVAVDASVPHAESVGRLEGWTRAAGEFRGPDAALSGGGAGAGLSLLPTPRASVNTKSRRAMTASTENGKRSGGGQSSPPGLDEIAQLMAGVRPAGLPHDEALPSATRELVRTLLPAPTQNMTTGPGTSGRDGGLNLQTAAVTLLPTPTVSDSRGGRNATSGRQGGTQHHDGWTLSDVAYAERWGVYADAIARWETVLDRPAPDPTQLSERNGRPQLSPRFVEWVMGVPEGWVTDGAPGIGENARGKWTAPGERNAFLSLLGDGVVPQWAAGQVAFLLPIALGRAAEAAHVEGAAPVVEVDPFDELVAAIVTARTAGELIEVIRGADAQVWAPEHHALAALRIAEVAS